MTSYVEPKGCVICGSTLLAETQHVGLSGQGVIHMDDMEFPAMAVCRYKVCLECGTILQSPRLSDADIEKMYQSSTYRDFMMRSSVEAIEEDEIRRAESIMRSVEGMKINAHLDIGSSKGFLLERTHSKFPAGVELDEKNRRGPVGAILASKMSEVKDNFYDLVTLIHVLEHVPYPKSFLIEATNKMTKDGTIIVEVPSDMSPGGWPRIPHLYHFPAWSMSFLMKKADLKITKIEYMPHLRVTARKNDQG